MKTSHLLLGGLGVGIVAAVFANRKAEKSKDTLLAAVSETNPQAAQAAGAAAQAQLEADNTKTQAAKVSTPEQAKTVAQQAEQTAAKAEAAVEQAKEATKGAPPEAKAEVEQAAKAVEQAKKVAKEAEDAAAKAKTTEEAKAAAAKASQAAEQSKQATQTLKSAVEKSQGNAKLSLRLTTYWPYEAKAKGKGEKMEGGIFDRMMSSKYKDKPESSVYKAHVLRTLEDFLAGKAEFVSLSGDDAAWPYGQLVTFPLPDGRIVKGRVVDTGQHFRGKDKVYRAIGSEPIDVCVMSSKTRVPEKVTATIVRGDHFAKSGAEVRVAKFEGQKVAGLDLLGASS